jgi:hypothetical protein
VVALNVTANNLTDVSAMVQSYTSSPASLLITAQRNSIGMVAANFFDGIHLFSTGVAISIDMSYNPIMSISEDTFAGAALLADVLIDVSFATQGSIAFPSSFRLNHGVQFSNFSTLTFKASGSCFGESIAPATIAFRGFLDQRLESNNIPHGCGSTCNLTLVFSHNFMSLISAGEFDKSWVTTLDLSSNHITRIADDAFTGTTGLEELILSSNRLTMISVGLQSNTPTLTRLVITNNLIAALPFVSNTIDPTEAANNLITCESYIPTAVGCTCHGNSPALHQSVHCGYVRCTASVNDCGSETLFNASSCTDAPGSTCVNPINVSETLFYLKDVNLFKPVTSCRDRFLRTPNGTALQSYR